MKRTIIALLSVTMLICAGSACLAQYEPDNMRPIGLKAAFFQPSDSILSDIKGTWIGPVVDYNLSFDKFEQPDKVISLGLFKEEEGITQGAMYPLTFTYLKRFGSDAGSTWYVGASAGTYFTSFKVNNPFSPISESGIEFGLGLSVGHDFGEAWYAELSYDQVGSMNVAGTDIGFSGLMLSFGTRIAY